MSEKKSCTSSSKETTPLKDATEVPTNYTKLPQDALLQSVSKYRCIILALLSVFGASVYSSQRTNRVVSSEQPLPLQKDLINDLGITRTEYTLLLAASTFPNIFFPLLGGWVFDSLGRR
eukprot:TRINITY_DN630_c0_g1_i22.p1 TRINITY_DN630_c0_g1~~TRINITY_DN630_c0_g1_i22.p1  ORF type:complete len:119 (-),score=17.49 TRINITY_DN630_c0_g1_i22:1189-1545(-)